MLIINILNKTSQLKPKLIRCRQPVWSVESKDCAMAMAFCDQIWFSDGNGEVGQMLMIDQFIKMIYSILIEI
jgi:hypothetical protein